MRSMIAVAGCMIATAGLASEGASIVTGRTALSAVPSAQAIGPAGPVNRVAFDLSASAARAGPFEVTCIYPDRLRYRCQSSADSQDASGRVRLVVSIPDLGRGSPVTVRIAGGSASRDEVIELRNVAQVVHEIEALPLPRGGRTAVGNDGQPVAITQPISHQATSMPSMAMPRRGSVTECETLWPKWVQVSATDPVFLSDVGPLNGSLVLARSPRADSDVTPDNLPLWLITYPLSARRVQFIAHYEVLYRVHPCPQRIIGGS
ncbi:MAG: hypothetical protein R3E77_15215 [Steroidobacteraceae bacterium]